MRIIRLFASLLLPAVMLISCNKDTGNANTGTGETPSTAKSITLNVDKDLIKSDGSDVATFTVFTDTGEQIKDEVLFFNENGEPLEIENFKFSTDKQGEYKFWAAHKTFNSQTVTIRAINATAPDVVTDPQPSNTSFARKMFIIQFTGTNCGFCPSMMYIMNGAFNTTGLKDKSVIAAVHSYNNNDPGYISNPKPGDFGGNGYPYLALDMLRAYGDYANEAKLTAALQETYNFQEAKVGISANPRIEKDFDADGDPNETDDYLLVRVSVKAAETGEYAVGAWLMEDGLYGKQADGMGIKQIDKEHDYDTHNNCVRVTDSKNGRDWIGHELGKIEAGKSKEKTFLIMLKDSWEKENMHLAIFVTVKGEDGYYVNNVIDCPIDSAKPFEYL